MRNSCRWTAVEVAEVTAAAEVQLTFNIDQQLVAHVRETCDVDLSLGDVVVHIGGHLEHLRQAERL
jgi:hypothetical protein